MGNCIVQNKKYSKNDIKNFNNCVNFLENTIVFGRTINKNIVQIINNKTFKIKKKKFNKIMILNYMSILIQDKDNIFIFGGFNRKSNIISKNVFNLDSLFNIKSLPDMISGRYSFSSLIKGDYIYVIGGKGIKENNIQIELRMCERLNLKTLTWENIAELNKGRSTCSAFIFNNKIYVFGGFSNNINYFVKKRTPKIERYNEELNIWEILNFKFFLGLETDISFISHKDNKILIFGGKSKVGNQNTVYEIDLFHETILNKKGLLNERVLNHLIHNKEKNEVLLIGGLNYSDGKQNNELYDYKNFKNINKKNTIISFDKSFSISNLTKIVNFNKNNKIHNFSKYDFENYNIIISNDKNPFMMLIHKNIDEAISIPVPMNIKLYNYQGIVRIKAHKIFLCGGLTIDNSYVSNKAFILDLFKMKGKRIKNMPNCKYTFSIIKLKNFVYCLGGRTYGNDAESILNECCKYDLEKNDWISMPNLNKKRCSSNAFIHNGEIYIAGGYVGNYVRSDYIEKYNPEKNKWYGLGIFLCSPLEASICFLFKEKEAYFISGREKQGDTKKIIKVPLLGDWDIQKSSIYNYSNIERCLLNYFIYDNSVVIFGGSNLLENSYKLEKIDIINNNISYIKLPNIENEIKKNFDEISLFKKSSSWGINNKNYKF